MNDKELADAVVALGVGFVDSSRGYQIVSALDMSGVVEQFVRDPRVAMALILKCQKIYIEYIDEPELAVYARAENNRTWDWKHGESLERTIVEACVEALSG